jgi:flagellar biosynthetic protein FlhB
VKHCGFLKAWPRDRQEGNGKFHIDILLFADESGEKTEKATPKKRQDVRKKGQVLQSREVNSSIVLMLVFLSLKLFGSFIYRELHSFATTHLNSYDSYRNMFTIAGITHLFANTVLMTLKVTIPVFSVALIAGVASSYMQVGFTLSFETLKPKAERLNPISGFKRIFSLRGSVELVKSVAKVIVTAAIAYSYLRSETQNVVRTMGMDAVSSAVYIVGATINIGLRISIALLVISALDYLYQWWQHEKDLRMTKMEVKEEFKQTEGNPEIKQRIKQKQRQISLSRMLYDIPKADVVITNPTHYAVAVRYDAGENEAPVVIGKGLDYIALRIREVAEENGIAVIENKPLARSLYEMVDIGQEIPEELYQAVAEILAYVYSLSGKKM